jgi:hypothetical protein
MIAEQHVALAKAQMREQRFGVGNRLQRADMTMMSAPAAAFAGKSALRSQML